MGRPVNGYFLADGTRVPGVTTVISRFRESGGLIHWAWGEGKAGRDYRETRDRAGDAGTMAHAAVEAWLHDRPFEFEGDPDVCAKAKVAFGAFEEWARNTQLRVTHTELSLISEKYRFGGTLDAILIGNRRAIGDWKSGRSIYPEHLIQVAAYEQLWRENFPDDPITGGLHIVKFDKIHGDFVHRWWNELERAWLAFRHLRALYDIDIELKARVG
jgi:hypothetical protein